MDGLSTLERWQFPSTIPKVWFLECMPQKTFSGKQSEFKNQLLSMSAELLASENSSLQHISDLYWLHVVMNAVEACVKLWFCCGVLKKGRKWETLLIKSSINRLSLFFQYSHMKLNASAKTPGSTRNKKLVNILLLYALLIKQFVNARGLPHHLFVVVFFTLAEAASLLLRWPRSFALHDTSHRSLLHQVAGPFPGLWSFPPPL